jgi:hypothetical protein
MADVHALDMLNAEPGATYVMDRGGACPSEGGGRFRPPAYDASGRCVLRNTCQIEHEGSSTLFGGGRSRDRRRLRPDDRLGRPLRSEGYPERLHRIRYNDAETGKALVFLTNHFELPALTVAALYKNRWQVELFFNGIERTWYVGFFSIGLANAKRRNGLASAFASSSGWCGVGGGRATRGWCHASVAVPRTTVYQRRCGLRSLRFYGINALTLTPHWRRRNCWRLMGSRSRARPSASFRWR